MRTWKKVEIQYVFLQIILDLYLLSALSLSIRKCEKDICLPNKWKWAYLLNIGVILSPWTLQAWVVVVVCALILQPLYSFPSVQVSWSLSLSPSLHFPKLVILTEHAFLHGQARSAYIRQNSCLLHIICALRVPSGRWNPRRACGTHWGSHNYLEILHPYGAQQGWLRFSLDMPPTCKK